LARAVLNDCTSFSASPAQNAAVCTLVQHQASLYYANPTSLDFTFLTNMQQAADF
jgi:hypothetical protein